VATCPSCSHENNDVAKFCEECGAKLDATPVREERKVITALFCDLVGSTALGERLDPEDISRLLRDYQAICRRRIESHGGVVEKFIGDAVVGVFGVPFAHEDDPERAVRAALRIAKDIGASDLGIEVRIGVNTGEALVRLDVDPRSGEGFATGDTMNTAARLEAAAPTMGVATGAATYRATEGNIVYEELPAVSAKGKAEPVEAWQALRAVSRIGTEERDRTPFVGRNLELSMLTHLFDRARTRPATEFVTIVAEPGLGKSRLIRELSRHVDALSELVTWLEGRCLPYGDGISFWALGEIVKSHAGILETDDQPAISTKLDAVLLEPDEQSRMWIKDRLAPIVGMETVTEPPQREEAFTAWRRFLEQIASARPTVLVIEDLHWADEAFVAFLEHLAERTAGLPMLVVVTARPEIEERHPSWPPGRRSTVLSLSPLDDADLQTLIQQTLPGAEPQLISVVLERAGGSPLYAEQLAAVLHDNLLPIGGGALDETRIPASVQALIAARIDALPPEPKRVLMEASVVGKTFWAGAISSLGEHEDLDGTLGELVRREFCRPVHPSTMASDLEFGFWHALVRDVAYAELTRAERARMHTATALWITDRTGGTFGEDAEIVVHHLSAALELAPAAPELDTTELTESLAAALIAAGEAAIRTDVPRAMGFLERALDVLPNDDSRRFVALRLLGISNSAAGDYPRAAKALEDVLVHHEYMGDTEAATEAALHLWVALWDMGEGARANAILARARAMLGQTPSPGLANLLAFESSRDSDHEAAIRGATESIAMAESLGIDPPPRALSARGLGRVALGDLEGEGDVRLAIEGSFREGNARGAAVPIFNLARVMSARGPRESLPFYEEALALADRFGMDGIGWGCRAGRLRALSSMGRFDEILSEAEPILEWADAHRDLFTRLRVLENLAAVAVERGDVDLDIEEFSDLARRMDDRACLILAAQLALGQGDLPLARSLLLEGAPHVEPGDMHRAARVCVDVGIPQRAEELVAQGEATYPADEAAGLCARAILAEARGDQAAARDNYVAAGKMFSALGMTPDRAHALQGLGRCLLTLGETEEGVARIREARTLWEQMQAHQRISEIDRVLASPKI
jgi:class 3 adenylate cyclase/tetratricopeptide (TPR) repeat protein